MTPTWPGVIYQAGRNSQALRGGCCGLGGSQRTDASHISLPTPAPPRPTPPCAQRCWAHSLAPWGLEGTAYPHDCGAAVEEGLGEPGAGGKEEGVLHPIIQGQ